MTKHQLKDLTQDFGLVPTYKHVHLGHELHVDMVLVTGKHRTWSLTSIGASDEDSNTWNSSTHVPVTCETRVKWDSSIKKNVSLPIPTKYKWEEASPTVCQQVIDEELEGIKLEWMDTEKAIKVIQSVIKTATAASVPAIKTKKRKGKARKWELRDAVSNSKKIHHEWKGAGQPGKEHVLSIQRRRAKWRVRMTQRQHEAEKRRSLLNKISQALESDNKLFYQLIRK